MRVRELIDKRKLAAFALNYGVGRSHIADTLNYVQDHNAIEAKWTEDHLATQCGWTAFDIASGEAEGWRLRRGFIAKSFDVYRISEHRNSVFTSHGHARDFVWLKAEQGSDLHERACAIITQSKMMTEP